MIQPARSLADLQAPQSRDA